jgi:hypothetical protein
MLLQKRIAMAASLTLTLACSCATFPAPQTPAPNITTSSAFDPRVYERIAIYVQSANTQQYIGQGALRSVEDEFLSAALANGYIVAARSDFEQIVREQRVQASNLTEDALARIGRALNVSAMLVVSVNSFSSERLPSDQGTSRYRYRAQISSRLIGAELAQVLWLGDTQGVLTETNDRSTAILSTTARRLANTIPPRLTRSGPINQDSLRIADSRQNRERLTARYFDESLTIQTFVEFARYSWDTRFLQQISTSQHHELSDVALIPPVLPRLPVFYGVTIGSPNAGLDISLHLHKDDVAQGLFGLYLEPFVPLRTTGLRVIAGTSALVGVTRLTMGVHRQQLSPVQMLSFGAGGEVRTGLAYHYRRGTWIFAEVRYRYLRDVNRQLDIPGGTRLQNREIPWASTSVQGGVFRFGVGF